MSCDNLYKQLFTDTWEDLESSWCKTCLKRNFCKIKETVSFEERMLNCGPREHITMTARCRHYIEDSKKDEKENKPDFMKLWKEHYYGK